MKKILLLGAFLYFFIAPLTYHPDNKAVLFWASAANGTVWNIWDYGEKFLQPNQQFNYPPLHFYLDKLQFAIAKPLGGNGFVEWLASPHNSDFFQPQLARFMMATKVPLILFGLIAGYLIYLLAKQFGLSETRSRVAASIWLFNPITIYSIPMMGQNDVMAIVFFLCGWLFLIKRPLIAGIIFGLAASVKTYPLIWLLFLLPATKGLSIKKKVAVFLISVLVYGMTLVPFLHNPTFLSVGMNSEINNRFLIPQINIGFDQVIYVLPVLLIIILMATTASPIAMVLTANLLLLGFSHFHPQWYTWVVPFFALWIACQKKRSIIIPSILLAGVTLISWLMVILLFEDKWLSTGMFSVTNPYLGNLPVIRDYLFLHKVDVVKYDSLLHTMLAGVGAIALVSLFSKRDDNETDFSSNYWQNIYSYWLRISKLIRVLITSTVAAGFLVIWVSILQAIPAPISSLPVNEENFVAVNEIVAGKFEAGFNNLFRFDLTFKNKNMKNKDNFLVSINDGKTKIYQQTISGLNIGEITTIRFDIPVIQENSKGNVYFIKIQPVGLSNSSTSGAGLIMASVEINNDKASLASQQFYKPISNLGALMNQTKIKIWQIVTQIPLYFVGLFVLLCLIS